MLSGIRHQWSSHLRCEVQASLYFNVDSETDSGLHSRCLLTTWLRWYRWIKYCPGWHLQLRLLDCECLPRPQKILRKIRYYIMNRRYGSWSSIDASQIFRIHTIQVMMKMGGIFEWVRVCSQQCFNNFADIWDRAALENVIGHVKTSYMACSDKTLSSPRILESGKLKFNLSPASHLAVCQKDDTPTYQKVEDIYRDLKCRTAEWTNQVEQLLLEICETLLKDPFQCTCNVIFARLESVYIDIPRLWGSPSVLKG